jgi:indoleamine 2,3-dioxygenase
MATSAAPSRRAVPFPIHEEDPSFASTSAAFALPSNHFLAQRPVTPPRPESVIHTDNWTDRARPDTSSLAAADYDVSVSTGFMPPEEPVQSLSGMGHGWDELETSLEAVQREAAKIPGGGVGKLSERWRESVHHVRVLSLLHVFETTCSRL